MMTTSAGSTLEWQGREIVVEEAKTADYAGLDVALFSAGATTSREIAEMVAGAGATVIDNSSAWRMHDEVPLVGVNLGRLGFLTDVSPEQMLQIIDSVLAGDYIAENRIMLEARLDVQRCLADGQ